MKVLLQKDVDGLGHIGDEVDVKNGYARNYLLPQGLAAVMSVGNRRRVEILRQRAEEERARRDQEVKSLADTLKEASVTIAAKANEEGHLFGSVSAAMIADALTAEGYSVDEKMVQLDEPIREIVTLEVPIRLTAELETSCKVWVVAE